jgi:hypothetical protein
MEKSNSSEGLRLLTAAHAISWSSSTEEEESDPSEHPLERLFPRRNDGWMEAKIHRDGSKFNMYLQSNQNDHPIFCAEKKRSSSFIIGGDVGNMDGGASRITGSLFKTKTKGSTIGYSLHLDDSSSKTSSKEVASIRYEIPSMMEVLMDGPPRRAQVFIAGRASVETKEPFSKEGGQRGLDFSGRGREPSRKNMQLQDPRNGKIAFQMVKWDKDDFHVDYA